MKVRHVNRTEIQFAVHTSSANLKQIGQTLIEFAEDGYVLTNAHEQRGEQRKQDSIRLILARPDDLR